MKLKNITLSICLMIVAFAAQAQTRTTTLLTPTNGQTLVPAKTIFTWDTVAVEVDSFELQLSKTMDFADTLLQAMLQGSQTTYTVINTLDFVSTYYWRVISHDSFTFYQETSSVFMFTVQGVPPGKPTNVSPTSASLDVSINPTLTWSTVADADQYHVQVSTYSNFSDTAFYGIVNAPTTTVNVNVKLLPYKVYYWRVAGSNANGLGEWSNFWNFTTLVTSINGPQANFSLNAYPNPGTDKMLVSFEGAGVDGRVSLYDLQGKEVAVLLNGTIDAGNQSLEINRNGLPAGMYMLRVEQNGQAQTLKVIFE